MPLPIARIPLGAPTDPLRRERDARERSRGRLVERHASEADVLVVAPALQRRLAFWTVRRRRPRRDSRGAARPLPDALLRAAGVAAEGIVGDADPLLAIEDALRLFAADEIVIATHPERRSNWLARNIVRRAGERFWHPIHHVVVETQPARG